MTKRALLTATCLIALLPLRLLGEPQAGPYLAARQAAIASDYAAGSAYFSQALIADPTRPFLLESAMIAQVGLGDFEAALPIAQAMVDLGLQSQLAHLVLSVAAANAEDWDAVIASLDQGREIGPLIDGLTRAWAYVGKGQMSAAIDSFDTLIEGAGLSAYGLYNKALALASVGDFEGADAIFSGAPENGMRYNRRSAIAHAQILSQLGRNAEATSMIDGVFGPQSDPTLIDLRTRLEAGDMVNFNYVDTAKNGMSELYLMVAQALVGDTPDDYTLRYARAAARLDPANSDAILLSADLLENMGQYDLASATYSTVLRDDPAFQSAELGRAETLRQAGKIEAAIEVLEALIRSTPNAPRVLATAGDIYREAGDLGKAKTAYTQALNLYDDADPLKWFIYYMRGITNHGLDAWPEAEADFRAALALRPDQPQVLNYLGYSMVERGINLDEALVMIETAVAAEPQNGAIVDSLGWVLFQLGDYAAAVGHLEDAASLIPVDPIINDHLGDAYWAVGRFNEAQFQWNRALSFDPTEEDAAKIRRKLEIGLDAVRAEDGVPPLAQVK